MRISRFGQLLVALALLIGLSSTTLQSAAAQDDQIESGVEGNSYTSPSFGYSITWPREWDVTDEASEAGYDRLVLDNGDATVYLEGVEDTASLAECVATLIQTVEQTDGVTEVTPTEDENGDVVGGSDRGREWAVVDVTFESGGNEVQFREYIDCRPIVEGESLLVITMLTLADDFDAQVEPLLQLLEGLEIEGGSTPQDDPEPDEPSTDEPSGSDLDAWVDVSARDINAFWEREFPRISGGEQYREPSDIIAFSETVDTACGSAGVMEIGPFYCPPDQTIYYDMAFAGIQIDAFGSPSVIAVVMAHETGHHVQNLMQWRECFQTPCLDPMEMTSQEFELQADCFAGAWVADAETRGRMGSLDVETNITQFAQWLGDDGIGNTADPGAHGKAASRVYWFLSGYFFGVERCLTVSAATDPARNGGGTTAEPTPEATDEPTDEPTEEPTLDLTPAPEQELLAIGDDYTVELSDETLSLSVSGTEFVDEIEGLEPDGRFLIVYVTVERSADAPGPMRYRSFVVTDSDGNEYRLDTDATDALLRTAFPDGIDENLDLDASYNIAFVFDVDAGTDGFVFSTSQGDGPVDLEV